MCVVVGAAAEGHVEKDMVDLYEFVDVSARSMAATRSLSELLSNVVVSCPSLTFTRRNGDKCSFDVDGMDIGVKQTIDPCIWELVRPNTLCLPTPRIHNP